MVAPGRRAQAFGLLGAALAAAGVGAGILAVLLGGVSLRLLFVADSVTCVAAAALILVWVHEPSTARPATSDRGPWRDTRLLVMLGVGTGFAFAGNLSVTALPLTVAARGLDPAQTGWLLAVEAVVTVAGQRFLRGAAARPFFLMAVGLAVVGAGFAVVAFAGVIPLLCLGAAAMALGQVFLLGPPYAVVAGLADDGSRAGYLAAYGTCWGIAQTLGPLASTRLLSIGVPLAWLTGTALCVLLAVLVPFAGRAVTFFDAHPSRPGPCGSDDPGGLSVRDHTVVVVNDNDVSCRTPLAELDYTVVDVETTGFTPADCGITEIGAVRVHNGRVVAEFSSLVNPGTPVPGNIEELTGIGDEMLAGAPAVATVLPGLLAFAEGSVLAAHNARFDLSFLTAACEGAGLPWPAFAVIDTVQLARYLMVVPDEVPDCKLGTLAEFFGTLVQPSHRALADARATAGILARLTGRLAGQGVTTLDDLTRWLVEQAAAQEAERAREAAAVAAAEAAMARDHAAAAELARWPRWLRWLRVAARRLNRY
jgi:DNA polymerase III epsilon subunit family exonuclease